MVGSQGTAFAYGESGLITCDHVLRYQKPPQITGKEWADDGADPYFDKLPDSVCQVVHPPTGERKSFKVVYRDAVRDLALLELIGEPFQGMRHFAVLETPILRHGTVGYWVSRTGFHLGNSPTIYRR
jgi:Trypsin-like peptidase domain